MAKPEVKQTDEKLGISLEMQNVTLLIIFSAVSCLSVKCPLLALTEGADPAARGVTAVLALLLGEPPSRALQSNPAAVAGFQQFQVLQSTENTWCYWPPS